MQANQRGNVTAAHSGEACVCRVAWNCVYSLASSIDDTSLRSEHRSTSFFCKIIGPGETLGGVLRPIQSTVHDDNHSTLHAAHRLSYQLYRLAAGLAPDFERIKHLLRRGCAV
jgi:hypothetical protein